MKNSIKNQKKCSECTCFTEVMYFNLCGHKEIIGGNVIKNSEKTLPNCPKKISY